MYNVPHLKASNKVQNLQIQRRRGELIQFFFKINKGLEAVSWSNDLERTSLRAS